MADQKQDKDRNPQGNPGSQGQGGPQKQGQGTQTGRPGQGGGQGGQGGKMGGGQGGQKAPGQSPGQRDDEGQFGGVGDLDRDRQSGRGTDDRDQE